MEHCVKVYAFNAFGTEMSGIPSMLTLPAQRALWLEEPAQHQIPLLMSLMKSSLGLLYVSKLTSVVTSSLVVNALTQMALASMLGTNLMSLDWFSWSWFLVKAGGSFCGGSYLLVYGS